MSKNTEPCAPNPDMPFRDKPWWCPKLIWMPIFWLHCAGYAKFVLPYDLMLSIHKQYYANVTQAKSNKDA